VRYLRENGLGGNSVSDELIFGALDGRFPDGMPDEERRRHARKENDRYEREAGLDPREPADTGKRKAAALAVRDSDEIAEVAAPLDAFDAIARAIRANEDGGAETLPSARLAERAEARAEELRADERVERKRAAEEERAERKRAVEDELREKTTAYYEGLSADEPSGLSAISGSIPTRFQHRTR
jgi:hypothetical protein